MLALPPMAVAGLHLSSAAVSGPEAGPGIVTSASPAFSEEPRTDGAGAGTGWNGAPSVRIVRAAVPPKVDGKLDDPCWRDAPTISDFTQVEPREGALPTERTEVRLLYDHDNLYIAIRCFDREPNRIIAKQMQREADMESDDTIALTFDPFATKRTGYLFKLTPAGATQDALLEADGKAKREWDTIWKSRPRIDQEGWSVELEIPFRSLSFDPAGKVWGFNVERVIRRKQEVVRWASPHQNKSVTSVASLGYLEDLHGMGNGHGLEFKPFVVARQSDKNDGQGDKFTFEPGFDLFYSITPSLTTALTVNTDFAEAEVDKRQVNLTRFPLFFPEKRDFFLQDSNLFSFGAYNGPLPFHSRRIGLGPSGETVGILAGGKLTGRIGNLDIGLLDVQVDDTKGVPSKNLSVGRASYRLGEESSVGGIFTYGDPNGPGDNWLVGTDVNYRNSHFAGRNILLAQAWGLASDSDTGTGTQTAFGGSIRYPNEPIAAEVYASQIDEDFNPALGFVRRPGVRQYGGKVGYRWRMDGALRSIGLQAEPLYVTNLDNELETEAWVLPGIDIVNRSGDSLSLGLTLTRENLREAFEIQPGVVIPVDDYRFNRAFGLLSTTSARPVSGFVSADVGGFYGGESRDFAVGLEWRVSRHAYLATEWSLSKVDLPEGDFDVVVGLVRANFSFTPNLSWNTVIQYDNVSETVGVNSRFKWSFRPGCNLFLVFNYGYDVEDGRFRTLGSEITGKLGWTLRF